MQRYDIINYFVNKYGFKSYLEIGVRGKDCFDVITAEIKHGVDPAGNAKYIMTSNDFFASHCTMKYDIVFIDGLHLREQVLKDIENSLKYLNDNGIIVVHDCLPEFEWHQLREGIYGKPWTGDVWKAFADLRCTRNDLEMYVVDTDCGCGVIKKGSQVTHKKPVLDWNWTYFKENRDTLLNVISVEEFYGRS